MPDLRPVVIYHGKCADGFSGAWAFWRKYKHLYEYFPGQYQKPPPDVNGRDVFLVDFSYKRDVVKELLGTAKSVTLIDHHKSALEDLWDLENEGLYIANSSLDKSGAVLAWEFVQAISTRKEKMPEMLKHVQDRDLWQFKLPGTREISEALFSEVYDFNVWDRLLNSKKRDIDKMITMGGLVVKKHFKDVEEILTSAKRPMLIGGHMVPVASMSYMMASDAGNIMSRDAVFAGTYYDTEKSRNFSLRSNAENINWMDVSLIAMQYGGGGHPHASGFAVPRTHELAMA